MKDFVVVWQLDHDEKTQRAVKVGFFDAKEQDLLDAQYPDPDYAIDVLSSTDGSEWGIKEGQVEALGFDPYELEIE